MTVRIKVLRCYVWSTLLYGCETWTIYVAMQKKIDAFETWLYRRMLRISWKDMVTNEEVYRRMNIKPITYSGHCASANELPCDMF